MIERPNVLLAALLLLAATTSALVLAGLAGLSGDGFDVLAAAVYVLFSACLLFLTGLDQLPLSSVVIVMFAVASVVALVRSVFASIGEARVVRALPLLPLDDPELSSVAESSGAGRIYVLPTSQPSAFCVGLLRPRVVLTEGLLARLDRDERAAVVWHEGMHARAHEPLKCLLARVSTRTFFWLPLLGDLLNRYLLAKELDADRRATANTNRRALVGALSEVAEQQTPAAAVGLAEFSAARIDRIFDPATPLPALFRARSVALTTGSLATLVLAIAFPTTLGAVESEQMWAMLTTESLLHGLPGMLTGILANLVLLTVAARIVRRFTR